MLTDKFCVFTDNEQVIAAGRSAAVNLTAFRGTGEPCEITVLVTSPYDDGASMTVTLQESDDGSSFRDVASFAFTELTGLDPKLSFALPHETKGKFLRLAYAVDDASTGSLWAGVTREQIGWYRRGLYIHKGKVVL